MSGTDSSVFAVYPSHASAEAAVNALRANGFATTDISVVAQRGVETPATTPEQGALSSEPVPADRGPVPAMGAALGWLVNIGAIAASGAMLLVAGPVMATLKGVSDTLLGVADALVGFGVPADKAKAYEDRVRDGAILLSVHGEDAGWIARGREIFEQTGAADVSSMYTRIDRGFMEVTPAK